MAEFYLRFWRLSSKFSYFGMGDVGVLGLGLLSWFGVEAGFIKRARSCAEFARSFSERSLLVAAVRVGCKRQCQPTLSLTDRHRRALVMASGGHPSTLLFSRVIPGGVDTDSPSVPQTSCPSPDFDPGINPGIRCTSVSGYLSVTYSGTDGRIMSGHDEAGKAASVSMLTPAGITLAPG